MTLVVVINSNRRSEKVVGIVKNTLRKLWWLPVIRKVCESEKASSK